MNFNMEMKCDLDRIYSSIGSEDFKEDFSKLDRHIKDVNLWSNENLRKDIEIAKKVEVINKIEVGNLTEVASLIEKFLEFYNEYKDIYLRLYCYTYLLVSLDGENIEALDMLDELEEKDNEFVNSFVIFTKWLKHIENLDEVIESSKELLEYKFYLREVYCKSKYILSENEEELIKRMQGTGSKAWQRLYMETVSSFNVEIDVNGELKEVSFGELKAMAYDKDVNLRKLACNAEKKACEEIALSMSSCINSISGEAMNIYNMKGYNSIVDKVLIDSRMDQETLNAMIEVIEENLNILHRYYKIKARILGHENKLPAYDLYAPIGNGSGKISYEKCKDIIISSFRSFSKDLSDFARRAFECRWIDAEPSPTKGNYAISIDIFPIQESRIMSNFSEKYIDVPILAHEIGHAYHSYCIKDEKLINTDYPTPIAETASIFCETIVNNELINTVHKEERLMILERSISDAAYYIVEMYCRFLFESELLNKRKEGTLSVNELNEIMKNSMVKAYGDSVDLNSMNSYSWITNIGFYMVGNEFLNFPYIFGVLFSKGLYSEYLKNKEAFVNNYNKFLKITSTNNLYDIAKFMNIDIHSKKFWEESFKIIEKDIEELFNEAFNC